MYHADFEKNIRGSITSVTDDPEMKRVKEVANVISQAAYTRGRSNSENADMEHRIGKSVANYCLAPGAVHGSICWPDGAKDDPNQASVSLDLVLPLFVVFVDRWLGHLCCHLVVVVFVLLVAAK